jgi:hypothetical protein
MTPDQPTFLRTQGYDPFFSEPANTQPNAHAAYWLLASAQIFGHSYGYH